MCAVDEKEENVRAAVEEFHVPTVHSGPSSLHKIEHPEHYRDGNLKFTQGAAMKLASE